MSRKLTVREIEQKYNLLLNNAKEAYKSSRGLKNSRGFKESFEFKDIQKRKSRAVKRKIKQIGSNISSDLFASYDKSNQKPSTEKRKAIAKKSNIKSPIQWIADHEIFYLVLSYGTGGKIKIIQSVKAQLENQGKIVTVVVFFPDGSSVSTSDEAQFLLNIEKLYTELIELQERTETYPLVDILSFGVDAKRTVISVRPVQEIDWLPMVKKDRHKTRK